MVFLINSLPFFIVILMGLVIRYAVPSKVGKVIFAGLTVLMLVVYFQIQPSYMPKGTVKTLPNAEFRTVDKPVSDLVPKPKSPEQYDTERNAAMDDIDRKLEEQIIKHQMKYYKE
jgi:hypothetical protein